MSAWRLTGALAAGFAMVGGQPAKPAAVAEPARAAPRHVVAPHAAAPAVTHSEVRRRPFSHHGPIRSVGAEPRGGAYRPPPSPPRQYAAPEPRRAPEPTVRKGAVAGGAYSSRIYSFHGGAFAAVRARPYVYARGYHYRPFHAGQRFPAFLLLSDYLILDWAPYNLSDPSDPALRWVRFGPDALLVNTYTGQIVDVAAGLFDDGAPLPDHSPQTSPDGPAPPPLGSTDLYDGPDLQTASARQPRRDADGTLYPGPLGYRDPPPPGGAPNA